MKPAIEIACHPRTERNALGVSIDLVVLAGFCAFLFFFGLGAVGLVGADEPRYAQIAREMLERHDWITPVLHGKPWLEKPVLYYWQAMLSYRIFGVSDWAARLPAALDATVMVAAIYLFVDRFGRARGIDHGSPGTVVLRRTALDAALIAASSAFILGFGHAASTDMPLAASFTIGMLGWTAWRLEQRRVWLLGFYFFMALSTLAKGPVAPMLAALIIVSFAALRREWKLIRGTAWWPGLLLYVAVAAPWYVLVQRRTGNFFRVFLLEHNLERFATPLFGHFQPYWYFAPVILLALAPWTVIAVAGFIHAVLRFFPQRAQAFHRLQPAIQESGLELLMVLWGVLPVCFFSFPSTKLPGYILPALPPFAMLAALWLQDRLTASTGVSRALAFLHALIAGLTLTCVLLSPYLLLHTRPPRPSLLISAGVGLAVFCIIVSAVRFAGMRILRLLTLLLVILGVAFVLRVAAPGLDQLFSARPVAREIVRLQPENVPMAAYKISRELEYGLGFYLDRPIARYERGESPGRSHLLIVRSPGPEDLEVLLPNRRLTLEGEFPSQQLAFYWVVPTR